MAATNQSLTFDGIAVGATQREEFPPLTRTMFVRYAGASGDFNPMHHDDTIATQVGNPSVFGHGMLTMGLAARVIKDWFGPESIRRFRVRFAKQVWPGDVLTCIAEVTGKDVHHLVAIYWGYDRMADGEVRAAAIRRPSTDEMKRHGKALKTMYPDWTYT